MRLGVGALTEEEAKLRASCPFLQAARDPGPALRTDPPSAPLGLSCPRGRWPSTLPQYDHDRPSRTWGRRAKITRQGHQRRRARPLWARAASSDAQGRSFPAACRWLQPLSPAQWTGCGTWLGSWPLGTGLPAPGVDVVPACTLSVPPGISLPTPSPGRAFLARLPPEQAELPGRMGVEPVTCGHRLFHV